MSEFTSSGVKTEGFSGVGYEGISLYSEEQLMREYADMPDDILMRRFQFYMAALQGDVMPRARASMERFLNHLEFEIRWRCGDFGGQGGEETDSSL